MHSLIKGYLSAIRRMQIVGGMGDPFTMSLPLLEYTLKGVNLHQAKKTDNPSPYPSTNDTILKEETPQGPSGCLELHHQH